MPTIATAIPLTVTSRLGKLRQDLDARIPTKQLERNLLIATWNLRSFGNLTRLWESTPEDSPRRDLASIHYITEIIRRFDVVALQEVKGNLRALRDTMKLLGPNWSFILTDVNRGDAGNGERMAYLFDTRRVSLSGLASELVVPKEWLQATGGQEVLTEQFVRSPYAVSFRSEGKTFILITLHIKYGKTSKDRAAELAGIARWIQDWATNINVYDQNLIALGDFNIDARGDLLDQTFLKNGLYVPPALQDASVTRSIFNEQKYYDQIAWFRGDRGRTELSMKFLNGGNYDFVPVLWDQDRVTKQQFSFMLSDHYPLWAEFGVR
ncbi:Deoxyribonuclease [Neolewinella maritima]|uniref:Deoxyribonuclease n=1 Tax=Neolewinella maritima TaxID=1383882 RepID=A0ABN8F6P4_9BACT|nr:endonuclease/exonuclease/phosphatase family protein [Neolewinella maritima]CAH1002600.1 Deoxyribonuclease [Neolewinella maritima]